MRATRKGDTISLGSKGGVCMYIYIHTRFNEKKGVSGEGEGVGVVAVS